VVYLDQDASLAAPAKSLNFQLKRERFIPLFYNGSVTIIRKEYQE